MMNRRENKPFDSKVVSSNTSSSCFFTFSKYVVSLITYLNDERIHFQCKTPQNDCLSVGPVAKLTQNEQIEYRVQVFQFYSSVILKRCQTGCQ